MPLVNFGPVGDGNDAPKSFAADGFVGGLNRKSMPQRLDDGDLSDAVNVYLRADGGIEMRKGMAARGGSLGTFPGKNIASFFQQVVNGTPQTSPVLWLVAHIGDSLVNQATGAAIGGASALGVGSKPMVTAPVFDPDHAGGASDVLVICTGVGGPYLFDGSTISTPAGWSGVASARWCAVVNGVLWFSGIPSQPNLVAGMVVGHPETNAGNAYFAMSRPVTGMASLGAGSTGGLVVGMTRGLTTIVGNGPYNFQQYEFAFTDGVVAGRTMLEVDGAIYFLGGTAFWRFDGAAIVRISDKVEPLVLNDPLQPDYPLSGDRTLSFAWAYNNRLHFAYDSQSQGYCQTYLVYDLVLQAWTILYGPKLSGAALLNRPTDANPPACVVLDATVAQAYNWDVYNGAGPNAHGVDDAGVAINAWFYTKFFKIDEPGVDKSIDSLYPELFVEQFYGTVTARGNYGVSTVTAAVSAPASAAAVWDSSAWDNSVWGPTKPVYFRPRLDMGNAVTPTTLVSESFAFGVTNNPADPPFRFAGISGTVLVSARN